MKYAPSTGCFYPDDIAYATIPPDAIDVTQDDFDATMAAQPGAVRTVVDGKLVISAPPPPSLTDVKAAKIAELMAAYQAALSAPVSFTTAAGNAADFAHDAQSKSNLDAAIAFGVEAQSWPIGFWLAADGSQVTPFTYADLQALAAALEAVQPPAYAELLAKIAEVNAAKSITVVSVITF